VVKHKLENLMNDEYQNLRSKCLTLQSQILELKAEILRINAEETTEPIMRKYLFAKSNMLMHRQKEISSRHHSPTEETHLDRLEKLLISIDAKLGRTTQTDIEKAVLDVLHKLKVSLCRTCYR
jgi:hypothetical protein